MCGIAGSYNINSSIKSILLSQTHRGPDVLSHISITLKNGVNLQLGHNRLKIICLSNEANQPYHDSLQQHFLTFNGEIYNHKELKKELIKSRINFHTTSDTEVLLKAIIHWGLKYTLTRINGMFAFAYFDKQKETLFLVRDRFGVKPLFYFHYKNKLIFASTSATIAKMFELKPNYSYLQNGIQFGIYEDGSKETVYQDLYSVLPGHCLKFKLGDTIKFSKHNYYILEKQIHTLQDRISHLSEDNLRNLVLDRLVNACKIRLNADVPIALALSGGLDSATISIICNKFDKKLIAFCYGGLTDKKSEAALAESIAKHHGIPINFIEPKNTSFSDAFWKTLTSQDAPFAGISVIAQYLLYLTIKEYGFKVVLGGQGGDEGFLGYRKFQLFYLKELIEKKLWLDASTYFINLLQMLWAERLKIKYFWKLRSKYFNIKSNPPLINIPFNLAKNNIGYNGNILDRQVVDILKYSLPTLLRYEDRNSMAHSIETRLPFMDYNLIELACVLPTKLKIRNGYGKWILRQLMKDMIPDKIRLARYKRGFDISKAKNIFQSLYPTIKETLSAHKNFFKDITNKVDLFLYFTPENLLKNPKRFNELSILFWLGQRYG